MGELYQAWRFYQGVWPNGYHDTLFWRGKTITRQEFEGYRQLQASVTYSNNAQPKGNKF